MSGEHSNLFRPSAKFGNDIELMLNAMGSIASKDLTYVATPITGGQRFVEWYCNGGKSIQDASFYRKQISEHVIKPNTEDANRLVDSLRTSSCGLFINPASLYVPHWGQDDYRHFWSLVIESFASRVILSTGWHLSIGCIYELLVSIELGLPISTPYGVPMEYSYAIELANQGGSQLGHVGQSCDFLDQVLERLTNSADNLGARRC
jgi:hypothetical protein